MASGRGRIPIALDADSATRREGDALHLEEGALHGETATKAAQGAVGVNGAMAGDDDWEGVAAKRSAHRAGGAWGTDVRGEKAIGGDLATRNGKLGAQHALLERCAGAQVERLQVKCNGVPCEVALETVEQIGHRLGRICRIPRHRGGLVWKPVGGQVDAAHRRTLAHSGCPRDGEGAEDR